MASDFDEKEIGKIFESYKLKRPPESAMENFESEVWKKIKAPPAGPGMGFGIGLSAVFLLAFLFAFFVWMRPVFKQNVGASLVGARDNNISQRAGTRPAPTDITLPRNDGAIGTGSAGTGTITATTESDFAQMAEDLLILEMLGEDEGLLDDFERLEADREFFIGTGSRGTGTITAG